ncbi:hypothetical protein E3N88_11991 [Mikania micrantha]|uniref:Uncharacterized protein n=1 Tax=Mikania micrantha TaxID=192012 RepID=A0A5N6P4K0_9ASTR|nr:hypothetical protein E3N88_11991 [Mikania micrantha]
MLSCTGTGTGPGYGYGTETGNANIQKIKKRHLTPHECRCSLDANPLFHSSKAQTCRTKKRLLHLVFSAPLLLDGGSSDGGSSDVARLPARYANTVEKGLGYTNTFCEGEDIRL